MRTIFCVLEHFLIQLEDLEITVADHVQRVARSNFGAAWDEIGASNELEYTFSLSSVNSLEEAVTNIIQFLGMYPCDRSDRVPDGKSSHSLLLAGKSLHYFLYQLSESATFFL